MRPNVCFGVMLSLKILSRKVMKKFEEDTTEAEKSAMSTQISVLAFALHRLDTAKI